MTRWEESSGWTGDGLRREVFYFASGRFELYGSLYLPVSRARPYGIVICGSWGVEADRTQGMLRELALGSAELGIAAMMFHYPGQDDSRGIMRDCTLDDLTQATLDATAQASRRRELEWIFVGLRLGAVVAARAGSADGASRRLLMIEPALDPAAYFVELARAARRASLGVSAPEGIIFGYSIPLAIRDDPDPLAGVTPRASEEAAVVRYAAETPVNPVLGSPEVIERPGGWRFQQPHHPQLLGAALGWLDHAPAGQPTSEIGPARAWGTGAIPSGPNGTHGLSPLRAPIPEPENVTEHAVLIATSAGPVGAVVSEPDAGPVASFFLFGGAGSLVATGSAGRAGPVSGWARTLRRLASLGLVTLRFDYPAVNESHMARRSADPHDLSVPREVMSWFHARTDGLPRLLAGVCFGCQLAAELAVDVDDLAGLALITPTLHVARGPKDAVPLGSTSAPRPDVDSRTIDAVAAILARAPVWTVAGDRELPGVDALRAAIGPRGAEIELDSMDGFQTKALTAADGPRVPRELTVAWAQRMVDLVRSASAT